MTVRRSKDSSARKLRYKQWSLPKARSVNLIYCTVRRNVRRSYKPGSGFVIRGKQRPIDGLGTGECLHVCANAACVFISGSRRARTLLSHESRLVGSRFRNWTPRLAPQSGLLDFHVAVVSRMTSRDAVRHGVRTATEPGSDLLRQSTVNLSNGTPGSPNSPVTWHYQLRHGGSVQRYVVLYPRSHNSAASNASLGHWPLHRDGAILSGSLVAGG